MDCSNLSLSARELRQEWPGRVLVREERGWEGGDIALETRRGEGEEVREGEVESKGKTKISSHFSALMLENREFHNPSYPNH